MKTGNIPATVNHAIFTNSSEKLKKRLESKVEAVFLRDQFDQYALLFDGDGSIICGEDVFLSHYIIGAMNDNSAVAGKLVNAIKAWFNMQYADRLSVIGKFRNLYNSAFLKLGQPFADNAHIVFCRIFVNELSCILADVSLA